MLIHDLSDSLLLTIQEKLLFIWGHNSIRKLIFLAERSYRKELSHEKGEFRTKPTGWDWLTTHFRAFSGTKQKDDLCWSYQKSFPMQLKWKHPAKSSESERKLRNYSCFIRLMNNSCQKDLDELVNLHPLSKLVGMVCSFINPRYYIFLKQFKT